MANYNPHAPYVIGQEWVPIRNAPFVPDNVTERGYTFRLDHAVTPVSGSYYIRTAPENFTALNSELVAVYPAGREGLTGPIKRLYVKPSAITTTGGGSISTANGVAALLNSTDTKYLVFDAPGNSDELRVNFDTNVHAALLLGKRILDIRVRYSFLGDPAEGENLSFLIDQINSADSIVNYRSTAELTDFNSKSKISWFSIGDLNPFWATTANPSVTSGILPWRFEELNRLRSGAPAADQLVLAIDSDVTTACGLNFLDLEIIYCEETRSLYGGRHTANTSISGAIGDFYAEGPVVVQLTSPSHAAASLSPGEYTVVITHTDLNAFSIRDGAPELYAVRELYQLPAPRGVRVTRSTTVDDQFTVTDDDPVLAHLTLHTASTIVTGVHAYGTSYGAPVYGTITATQEVEDDPVGTAKTYHQVRFYARYFGTPTVPLTLTDVGTGTHTVTITAAELDALDEIVDGWREVTLRFATPPTFSTTGPNIFYRWSATGELAGNQWQILAADGPSGTVAALRTHAATYWAPFGSTAELNWQSPTITGTADDDATDAVLIFSQDPHPVSGFSLDVATQTVTGVALDCGTPPGCVPTGISYVDLTWSAQTLLPVTGFGAYELERYDARTGSWQLIMSASSPTVTGYADHEVRVGVESLYRIRTTNVLDFAGPWVTGAAVTVPTPGVAGAGDGSSVLIFTSNEDPGASLAYVMQWEGTPVETFVFPEAGFVQLQRIFGKDYFTAFHPLERGGEQFSRTILVNAAAITPQALANFTNLRDMAWAELNYVCVRDELGNRWFANVRVPDGIVRDDRTIYLAQVQVAQVTDTPTPVDPAA